MWKGLKYMASSLLSRVNAILRHIDTIQSDIKDYSLEDFKKSDLLVRATCFSLSQIGEQMSKLEETLRPKYQSIPWNSAIRMRTLIVHVYNKVKAEVVYNTSKNDLEELKQQFLIVARDIEATKN